MVTNSIELNVAEELPFKEGVWVRYIETEKEKYIIVEQLLSVKTDYKKNSDGFSYSIGGNMNDYNFVEIMDSPTKGLDVMMKYSQSKPKGKNGNIFDASMMYSFKKYIVTTTDDFKGKFELKEKHLKNIPKKTKVEIDNVVIEK